MTTKESAPVAVTVGRGYAEAEAMLADIICRDSISDTAIRVARDHMMQFAALAQLPAVKVDANAWELPDLRDLHNDVKRLRNHDLGNSRMRDLLRGAMDMLKAADVEYAVLQSAALESNRLASAPAGDGVEDRYSAGYSQGAIDADRQHQWMQDKAWQDAVLMLVHYKTLAERTWLVGHEDAARKLAEWWGHARALAETKTAEDIAALARPRAAMGDGVNYESALFDVLETLKAHYPSIAGGFARGTGGFDRDYILDELRKPASAPAGYGVDIAAEMLRFEATYPLCNHAKYRNGEVIAGRVRYAEPEFDKMFSAWLSSRAALALQSPPAAKMEPSDRTMRNALQDIAEAEAIPNDAAAFVWCRDVARAALQPAAQGDADDA